MDTNKQELPKLTPEGIEVWKAMIVASCMLAIDQGLSPTYIVYDSNDDTSKKDA
jgi:hypothetical protein